MEEGVGWRAWLSWRGVLGAGGLCAVAAIVFLLWQLTAPSAAEDVASQAAAASGGAGQQLAAGALTGSQSPTLLVYVEGAVASPGLYRLNRGLRVIDAVIAAGGLLADADPYKLPNLAARLSDGKLVRVPKKGSSGGASKLDMNTASVPDLEKIPGINVALAQAIVEHRNEYGPFDSLTQLHTELGLDTALVSFLRHYLVIAS